MVTSAPTLGRGMDPRVPSRRMLGGILLGTLVAGAIAGELVATGRGIVVLAFVLLFVPVVIARSPDLAPAFVLAPALLIEQSPIGIGSGINRITDHLPLFGGLGPSHLDGSDLLLIGLFIIWAVKVAQPSTRLPRSAIGTSLIVLEAAVVLGFVVGFAHHGDSRIAFLEMRPYVYLAASFFLASRLGTTERSLRVALWAIVLGLGPQGRAGARGLPPGAPHGPAARLGPRARGGAVPRDLPPAGARPVVVPDAGASAYDGDGVPAVRARDGSGEQPANRVPHPRRLLLRAHAAHLRAAARETARAAAHARRPPGLLGVLPARLLEQDAGRSRSRRVAVHSLFVARIRATRRRTCTASRRTPT